MVTRIGTLDFNDIKASIKNYLKDQPEFTDYNFEGSAITQLINVLAYNSHYDALAANFLANEMFLDTAVKRSSVISRAKELGYIPRSRRASRSTITLTISNVTDAAQIETLLLPRGSRFTSSVGDSVYTFTTISAISIPRIYENSAYKYRAVVNTYEGILTQQVITYNDVDPTVLISNTDIDTSTLKVEVSENGIEWTEYVSPNSFLVINESSKVYMLQEGIKGFEIYFGDGTFGYKPPNASKIRLTYVVTSGPISNGAVNFTLASTISGTTNAVISATGTVSAGGLLEESIDSIRSNAVLQYGSQNRAVVARDYAALAMQNFSEIKDCLAWDGSDNFPPKFGKVMLCCQPTIGSALTTVQRNYIASYLQSKGVANVKIEFVDPQYVELIIDTTVKYDVNTLNIGTYELEYAVKTAINTFAANNIFKFGSKLRYSNLVKTIDDSNYAITSNITNVKLLKKVSPNVFGINNVRFAYANAVLPNTFSSSLFSQSDITSNLYFKDDGNGKINIVYDMNGITVTHKSNVGLITYRTGEVQLDSFELSAISGLMLEFVASPLSLDITSDKNIILNLSTENIDVKVIPDL